MIKEIKIKDLRAILEGVQISNNITLDYDLCGLETFLNEYKETHYRSALESSKFICKVLNLDPEPYNQKYIEKALIKRKLREKITINKTKEVNHG